MLAAASTIPPVPLPMGVIRWASPEGPDSDLMLILIRGIPGTGKTTLAQRIVARMLGAHWWEADMFFETKEGYVYNPKKIAEAHEWCNLRVLQSLKLGANPVIVSNTFTRMWEMAPYFNICRTLGAKLQIIELYKEYGSVHGVPEASMARMRAKWEQIDTRRLQGIDFHIITEHVGGGLND